MPREGYYTQPSVHGEQLAFICEDDLWLSGINGETPRRMTTVMGIVKSPCFSSDGSQIAFVSNESGNPEIYIIPSEGGMPERQTYTGSGSIFISGWSEDDAYIYFCSVHKTPFRVPWLYSLRMSDGNIEKLPEGEAPWIQFDGKKKLLGRNKLDSAYWKRYKGGTAGDIWIDRKGNGSYERLLEMQGNHTQPFFINGDIYFISDYEGHANIYRCNEKGKSIKRITAHDDFYVRFPRTDGHSVVYQSGGRIFYLDPKKKKVQEIPLSPGRPSAQTQHKFTSVAEFLEHYDPHPSGGAVAFTSRGKPFSMDIKTGPAFQNGIRQGVRYRLATWMPDGEHIIAVTDEKGEERLVIFRHSAPETSYYLDCGDIGRPLFILPSPDGKFLALTNHRYEVMLVDLKKNKAKRTDKSDYDRIRGISWSPDSKWLAYGFFSSAKSSRIKLSDTKGKSQFVTSEDFIDYNPAFDPAGKYLYFLSNRAFNPVYDSVYFDLNFPRSSKPYAITLQKDERSPFLPRPALQPEANESTGSKNGGKDKKESEIPAIDLDNIENRIAPFPLEESNYAYIEAASDKVYILDRPVEGMLSQNNSKASNVVWAYDHNKQKTEQVLTDINEFALSRNGKKLIYRKDSKLREVNAGTTAKEFQPVPGISEQENGWIDLGRARLQIDPAKEWQQMYREAWRLMRDHFWTADMSGIDWEAVYKHYLPLVNRISSRSEFSDLMWEMQGELGTSHAYEMGGEFRNKPDYPIGLLGVDWKKSDNKKKVNWKVEKLYKGDPWSPRESSPLTAPGVHVNEGDILLDIDGMEAVGIKNPEELLQNAGGKEVRIRFKSGKTEKTFHVKALRNDMPLYYRQWVENNRQYVHEATNGRVGYVHIPDMGPKGYAEFHRYYMSEAERESLIVDVRYNGGGHVSQLLLEKLQRKRLGYDFSRHGKPSPFPEDSVMGKTVALTNQFAGSDGDIFTHCFKLMKLGTVIGKRTWGGVIGIYPRHQLTDGTVTTQPEFSFWFRDVYWGVENYGTDPHIDVDIKPQDFATGKDPQMDKAIAVIKEQMKAKDYKPLYPEDTPRPDRSK